MTDHRNDEDDSEENDETFSDLTNEYLEQFTDLFHELFNELDDDDEDDDMKRDAIILSTFLLKKYIETQVIKDMCCEDHAKEMTADFNNIANEVFQEEETDYSKLN